MLSSDLVKEQNYLCNALRVSIAFPVFSHYECNLEHCAVIYNLLNENPKWEVTALNGFACRIGATSLPKLLNGNNVPGCNTGFIKFIFKLDISNTNV